MPAWLDLSEFPSDCDDAAPQPGHRHEFLLCLFDGQAIVLPLKGSSVRLDLSWDAVR